MIFITYLNSFRKNLKNGDFTLLNKSHEHTKF